MPGLPDELYIVGEESRLVITALESLGRSDQEILRLAAWEELPHAEIADVLGISVHAVRQRLHKAKKRLAKSYDSLERRRTTPAARKGGTW
jgi:RNA polymerase sigma factor (sigma-70 family)